MFILRIFCNFVLTKKLQKKKSMKVKIYVISGPEAINFMQNDDLEGFRAYLSEEENLYFAQPEYFDSETEATAFCSGIAYGADERGTAERYVLRSCEPVDLPFMEAIENY